MYKIFNMDFETETEFRQQMDQHTDMIHNNTLYGIDKAFNTDKDTVVVALLNGESVMGIPKEEWMDNLDNTEAYFASTEEYEKCAEVVQLKGRIIN